MPALPLPSLPVSLDGGDLPVSSTEDIAAVEPYFVKKSDSAPVRDAIRAALAAIFVNYQNVSARASALSDVTKSVGIYLDGLGRDLGVYRQSGELDAAYRTRILAAPSVVTPSAILAAVNTILATYTTVLAQYYEAGLDCWFLDNTYANWSTHVFSSSTLDTGYLAPEYPDRLYAYDAADNGGYFREQAQPGGACVFDSTIEVGRMFALRIPDLSAIDSVDAYVGDGTEGIAFGLYLGDGTETVSYSFFYASPLSEYGVYDAIINSVDRIRGHGVRWTLLVDPTLSITS